MKMNPLANNLFPQIPYSKKTLQHLRMAHKHGESWKQAEQCALTVQNLTLASEGKLPFDELNLIIANKRFATKAKFTDNEIFNSNLLIRCGTLSLMRQSFLNEDGQPSFTWNRFQADSIEEQVVFSIDRVIRSIRDLLGGYMVGPLLTIRLELEYWIVSDDSASRRDSLRKIGKNQSRQGPLTPEETTKGFELWAEISEYLHGRKNLDFLHNDADQSLVLAALDLLSKIFYPELPTTQWSKNYRDLLCIPSEVGIAYDCLKKPAEDTWSIIHCSLNPQNCLHVLSLRLESTYGTRSETPDRVNQMKGKRQNTLFALGVRELLLSKWERAQLAIYSYRRSSIDEKKPISDLDIDPWVIDVNIYSGLVEAASKAGSVPPDVYNSLKLIEDGFSNLVPLWLEDDTSQLSIYRVIWENLSKLKLSIKSYENFEKMRANPANGPTRWADKSGLKRISPLLKLFNNAAHQHYLVNSFDTIEGLVSIYKSLQNDPRPKSHSWLAASTIEYALLQLTDLDILPNQIMENILNKRRFDAKRADSNFESLLSGLWNYSDHQER